MARKFWERVSGQRIQFYDEPQDFQRDDVDARIVELQDVLALPANIKALLVQSNPIFNTEAEFDRAFSDELEELADLRDYYGYTETQEIVDVFSSGWLAGPDFTLGPATVVSSSQTTGVAAQAIDGVGNQQWEENGADGPHFIVIGWGYSKRLDGIRFRTGASASARQQLNGLQVFAAGRENALPDNQIGTDLVIPATPNADPFHEFDVGPKNARFLRLDIGGSAQGQDNITINELELRFRTRDPD